MTYTLIPYGNYEFTALEAKDTLEIITTPVHSDFQRQDFNFRISKARMYLSETEFTHLPGYDRSLILLHGQNTLVHTHPRKESFKIQMQPNDIHYFSGDDHTLCYGATEDFNIIHRRNKDYGIKIELIPNHSVKEYHLASNEFLLIYSLSEMIDLDIRPDDAYLNNTVTLDRDSSLILNNEKCKIIYQNATPMSVIYHNQIAIAVHFRIDDFDELQLFRNHYLS